MSNNLVFLRRALYQLKRDYGYEAALYRTVVGATDLGTGEKSVTRIKYKIAKCIVIPFAAQALGFYSSAYLKAAREFAYGGLQDQDVKQIIIDGADLPAGFRVQQEDYLVYEHKKFEMVKFMEMEQGLGWQLLMNGLRGAIPNEVHEASVFQTIRFVGVTNGG